MASSCDPLPPQSAPTRPTLGSQSDSSSVQLPRVGPKVSVREALQVLSSPEPVSKAFGTAGIDLWSVVEEISKEDDPAEMVEIFVDGLYFSVPVLVAIVRMVILFTRVPQPGGDGSQCDFWNVGF